MGCLEGEPNAAGIGLVRSKGTRKGSLPSYGSTHNLEFLISCHSGRQKGRIESCRRLLIAYLGVYARCLKGNSVVVSVCVHTAPRGPYRT